MKKFNYDQARKRIELATAIFSLTCVMMKFALLVHSFLSVALNYTGLPPNAKQS